MKKIIKQLFFILFFAIIIGLFVFRKSDIKDNLKEPYVRVGAREYIKDQNNINHNDVALATGPRGNTIYIPNNILYQNEKKQWYNYW